MAEFEQEFDAFLHFFATFELARPISVISDLSDGAALFEILSIVYVFNTPSQWYI